MARQQLKNNRRCLWREPFLLLLLLSVGVFAGDDNIEPGNYAFANYIGSGIYQASGRSVTVFNMPFSYKPEGQGESPYTIRLPVSLGFYDFDFDEVTGGDFPDKADTLTLVPGIEWDVSITDSLRFVPYIDLGLGFNLSSQEQVLIYSTGVSSFYEFGGGQQHLWANRIFYAAYKGLSVDVSDGYGSLQSGLDYHLPFKFQLAGRDAFVSSYGLTLWHFNKIEFTLPEGRVVSMRNNYELGFSLGFAKPLDFWLFDLERIGIGYRFGDRLKLWRLTFNLPI